MITQKEKVVRFLANNMGNWINSYELVKASTENGFTGLQADRRAFELAKLGYYDSPNYRYFVEKRKQGKYTQFRIAFKTPLNQLKEKYELTQLLKDNQERVKAFEAA